MQWATTKLGDLLGAALTAAVVGVTAYVVFGANVRHLRTLAAEQRALSERLNSITAVTDALGQGEQALAKLQAEIDKLQEYVPASMQMEDFYLALAEYARSTNVFIQAMQPGELKPGDGFVELPITINASTSFEALHRFLYLVRNVSRLAKWDFLSITSSDDDERCNVSMTVKIYAMSTGSKADAP